MQALRAEGSPETSQPLQHREQSSSMRQWDQDSQILNTENPEVNFKRETLGVYTERVNLSAFDITPNLGGKWREGRRVS